MPEPSPLQAYALRLAPGDDLRGALEDYCRKTSLAAACVMTCVGSLSVARLRFAGGEAGAQVDGPLEIVSLVGTLGPDGAHLHLAVSDAAGKVSGGHVVPGCIVRTTAELVLGELAGLEFRRAYDPRTGYRELVVGRRP